jgi:hypothetical protein
MRLATMALAAALALSSTFAFAYTGHHRTYHHGYHGTVGMSSARTHRGSINYGRYGGSANSRGGLVGGADPGTYKP